MGISDARRSYEPHDRLTMLGDAMLETLDHQEGGEEVRAIVMLDDGDNGGIAIHGYDSDHEAITDMFVHLAAIFAANGQTLMLIPMPSVGQG